jgi:hypothetical protein
MDNYAQSKEKGVKRGQYERATGAPDLVIWGVEKVIFSIILK